MKNRGVEHLVLGPPLPQPLPTYVFFEVSAYRNKPLYSNSKSLYEEMASKLRAQGYRRIAYTGGQRGLQHTDFDDLWGLREAVERSSARRERAGGAAGVQLLAPNVE